MSSDAPRDVGPGLHSSDAVCATFYRYFLQAGKLGERLAAKGLQLQLDEGALAFLADRGFDPAFGARPVKRAIQRELESPLAKVPVSHLPHEIPTSGFSGAVFLV